MSMSQTFTSLWAYLPRVLGALMLSIVGYIVAVLLRRITYSVLSRLRLDERLDALVRGRDDTSGPEPMPVESYLAAGVFLLTLVGVATLVLQALGLTLLVEPLNVFLTKIVGYLPNVIGPAVLLLVAWIVASAVRLLVRRGLESIDFDRRFHETLRPESPDSMRDESQSAAPIIPEPTSLTHTLSELSYWLVLILFLPAILEGLQLQGLLEPVAAMVDEFLAFIPNLFAAGIILTIGYLIARLLQRLTTTFFASLGTDDLAERPGVSTLVGRYSLSRILGTIVFALVLIPVVVAALNALDIAAVTRPASAMLDQILAVIPDVAAAVIVVVIAYAGGRLVGSMLATVLAGIGFDDVPEVIGVEYDADTSRYSPSEWVGWIAFGAILMLGGMEGCRTLGLTMLSGLVADFALFGGKVLLGVAVFVIGLALARFAGRTIERAQLANARMVAHIARASIIVLAAAMALREMGIADPIINLAFGLGFGAIALAVAIAFGLGAREPAGDLFREFVEALRTDTSDDSGRSSPPSGDIDSHPPSDRTSRDDVDEDDDHPGRGGDD